MMHPLFGVQPAGPLPVTYPHDVMLDDHAQQMACSQTSRRFSRGSNGQRSGGNSTRITKPSSASNSPRSSGLMARRKTLMNDGNSQRRQQQIMDQLSSFYDVESQQHMHALTPSYTPADQHDQYGNFSHYSPMMGSTSCGTSPLAFSHLPLPYQHANNMPYNAYPGAGISHHSPAASVATDTRSMPATSAPADTSYNNGWDWNNFIMHGFGATTPPTPETLPQSHLSQPAVSEDIQYQALEDASEEEGEILVGMGLYDAPEKFNEDPQLDNYRSTVSSLLGSSFRSHEPSGKGLKLEETWEPPKSEDEDEDDEEEEDDDEEDKDDEE